MKIRPVGAELFHADRQTDMTKLIVAFHNVAKAPKSVLMGGQIGIGVSCMHCVQRLHIEVRKYVFTTFTL
jgi:hypothetical protein